VLSRYEQQRFSAVTHENIVIGTFYCNNLTGNLTKDEYIGKEKVRDLTYGMLQDECIRSPFFAFRGKINGEVFDSVTPTVLQGFERLEFTAPHGIRVAEYYAGKLYIVSPSNWVTRTLALKKGTIECVSHPFFPISAGGFKILTSRYEGIMLWNGHEEIRCKDIPTCESFFGSMVWEVDRLGTKMRPRPGKLPTSLGTVHACVPAVHAKKWLLQQSVPQVHRTKGSKAIVWRSNGDVLEYLLVKERLDKEFDLPGGHSLAHETSMECMIREGMEELGVPHDYEFVTLSCDSTYGTAVFCAPFKGSGQAVVKWVDFTEVPTSPPWISRILKHIAQRLGDVRNVPLQYKIKTRALFAARCFGHPAIFCRSVDDSYVDRILSQIGVFYCPAPYGTLISRAHTAGFFLHEAMFDSYRGSSCFGEGYLYGCYPVRDEIRGNRVEQYIGGMIPYSRVISKFLIRIEYPSSADFAHYVSLIELRKIDTKKLKGYYTYEAGQIAISDMLSLLVRKSDLRELVASDSRFGPTEGGFVVF